MCAAVAVAVAGLGGCTSTIEVRPAAQGLADKVTAIVALPTSIDFGGMGDQRRIQRRTSDALLAMTAGHVVIAEELRGEDDPYLQSMLRRLGEDPTGAISISITVGLGRRFVAGAAPIPGFQISKRMVVDFHAHVDVRRVGSQDVVGVVETVASGPANEPELGPDGERRGALEAIDDALEKTLRTFAPGLAATDGSAPSATVVEVPVEAAGDLQRRLTALAELYPELGIDEMQLLGGSGERILVLAPGGLAALGIRRGDLLGVPAGADGRASRAALVRAMARRERPQLAITRAGQHYILAAN
jgi:hypothetical protein